jgi:hypothetical protein
MPKSRIVDIGAAGLNTDILPSTIADSAWTSLYNCQTEDKGIRSAWGERKLFDLSIRPLYHTTHVIPGDIQIVVVSDGEKVLTYTMDGVEEDITPEAGDWSDGIVSFTNLNGVLVVNSQTDGPFFWAGPTTKLEVLPGWDPTWSCRDLRAYRYYLVALGMTEGDNAYPHKVRWSNSAAEGDLPTEWVATIANDAGADLIGESDGAIVGGTLMRDSLYVVKEDAVYSMDWVGGDFVMQLKRLDGGIGTRVRQGFAEMLGTLLVFNSTDLRGFDGTTSTSLVEQRVRRGIYNVLSEELWDRTQIFVHYATSQIFVNIAESGYSHLSTAFVYNWEENTWSRKKLKFSYGMDAAFVTFSFDLPTWDELAPTEEPIVGPPQWKIGEPWDAQTDATWNKGVYQPSLRDVLVYESAADDSAWWVSAIAQNDTDSDGTPKYCEAVRLAMPIEDADGLAMVTRCWPELEGTIPISIAFGGQMEPSGTVRWGPPQQITPGQGHAVHPRITGRFVAIKVTSNASGWWRLSGLTFEWQRAGER